AGGPPRQRSGSPGRSSPQSSWVQLAWRPACAAGGTAQQAGPRAMSNAIVAAGFRAASAVSQRGRPEHARSGSGSMMSLESWWWPKRPARVPRARTAGLLAGLGAALFGVSAVLLKTGTLGWDESLFRLLNEVPAAAASVLTPLSRLFLPAGIITAVVLIVVYVLARNRSILPVVAGAAAAGVAWMLAHVAKAMADAV